MPALTETNQRDDAGAQPTSPPGVTPQPPGERSLALDAYRGLIMVLLISHGFGLSALKDHWLGKYLAQQVDHVQWEGLVLWDLIQPAFMFMVGVAMPYAFARRGSGGWGGFTHALRRSAILIFLSQLFVAVQASGQFQFGLINVLSQIAFTYLICFLLMRFDFRVQAAAAVALLGGHWLLFLAYPGPAGPFSPQGNVGQVIDQWLLGRNYSGYYVTINLVSSTVTTLFGVWAGMLMRRPIALPQKLRLLLSWAGGCLAGGLLLSLANPMVKRIWTASSWHSRGSLASGSLMPNCAACWTPTARLRWRNSRWKLPSRFAPACGDRVFPPRLSTIPLASPISAGSAESTCACAWRTSQAEDGNATMQSHSTNRLHFRPACVPYIVWM